MRAIAALLFFAAFSLRSISAQPLDSLKIQWSAFVDTYYMYDFNNLPDNKASHAFTQPLRHNEFNVNLAHIEAKLSSPNIRGVLSLQTGTSVKATYAAEVNNRELSQIIHEAWAGYQVASGLWIDAGIYPAPYTWESWFTRDNKTYTHSITTEFVPFYQAGVRAFWQPNETFSGSLNLLNGWQNISETNNDKAIGLSLAYTPETDICFVYNNFIGNEQPVDSAQAIRFFNDICLRLGENDKFQLDVTYDFGTQKKDGKARVWMGTSLIARIPLRDNLALAIRGEYYKDQYQVIYVTGTDKGFDGFGASVNFDVQLSKALLWRTEARVLKTKYPVFASKGDILNHTGFVVTSLAFSF